MNLWTITKNQAADLEKGLLRKSNLKPFSRNTAMPTA